MSSAFKRFLNSPTGPKTVHFWAPAMKWGLVIAGASDFVRPVEKVSALQQLSLFCTGAIWTRWSMVIIPKNYLLASVNFFLAGVASAQIGRIAKWRHDLGEAPGEIIRYMLDMDKKELKEVHEGLADEASDVREFAHEKAEEVREEVREEVKQ